MKKISLLVLFCLTMAMSAWATVEIGGPIIAPGGGNGGRHITTLDEQCVLDFTAFTTGTSSGTMTWPGGSGDYRMTGLCFTNSCDPLNPFYTFCVDLNHALMQDPYCVNIDSLVVRSGYPEQYPALAYVLTWYPVLNDADDRIQQLAVWKLSNDTRTGEPTSDWPMYYIDGGRGYPLITDPPAFPYVNTVFNSDPANNDPANTRVLDAIGYGPDGLAKNVILCDDELLVAYGEPVIDGGNATVPVTVTLVRGPSAALVNNLSVSGVKLLWSVDNGTLSLTEGHTNAAGEVYGTVTQPVGTTLPSNLTICSYGLWPRSVVPCDTVPSQQLLVQSQTTGELCTLCVSVLIPPDNFLAVELTSFDAISRDNGVELAWRTAAESNADRWIIERRSSGHDFSTLAILEAQNSQTGASYRYLDSYTDMGVRYDYRLVDIDLNGTRTVHDDHIVTAGMAGTIVPGYYELSDNFPNPFNPETTIRFTLGDQTQVSLTIYDLAGNVTEVLVDSKLAAGTHSVNFNAAALPSGTYFYKLVTPGFTSTKKMVLMK